MGDHPRVACEDCLCVLDHALHLKQMGELSRIHQNPK
jgi:hypothetical protein